MEKIWAIYDSNDIQKQIYKVISTRSLPIEHFSKQLKLLIDKCQNEAYNQGKADYIEMSSYYGD